MADSDSSTPSGDRPGAPERGHAATSASGPGAVKRTTATAKRIALVALGALGALFAVANRQTVEIHWIFGEPIRMPLILVLVGCLALGAAVGWLMAKMGRRGSTEPGSGAKS